MQFHQMKTLKSETSIKVKGNFEEHYNVIDLNHLDKVQFRVEFLHKICHFAKKNTI